MDYVELLKRKKIEDLIPDSYLGYKNIKLRLKEDKIESLLDLLGYDFSVMKKVKGVGKKRFKEVETMLEDAFLEIADRDVLERIKEEQVLRETRSIGEVVEEFGLDFDEDRDIKVLRMRYLEGRSLNEIGEIEGFSRERIRQIENMQLKKINLEIGNSVKLLRRTYGERISLHQMKKILPKERTFLGILKKNKVEGIYFDEEYGFYFDRLLLERYREMLGSLPDYGRISTLSERFKEVCEEVDNKKLLKEYVYEDFMLLKKYFAKRKKVTKTLALELFLLENNTGPFLIDEDNVQRFCKYCRKVFGVNVAREKKTVLSVIKKSDKLMQVGKSMYQLIEYAKPSDEEMRIIGEVLQEELDEKDSVRTGDVFRKISDRGAVKCRNKRYLHSLVKLFFGEYKTTSGTRLEVYKGNVEIKTNARMLIEFCENNGGIVSLEDIEKEFGWRKIKIYNTMGGSEAVKKIGVDKCGLVEELLDEKVRKKLESLVEKNFGRGQASVELVFDKVKADGELKMFFERYGILDRGSVVSVLKVVDERIKKVGKVLYKE